MKHVFSLFFFLGLFSCVFSQEQASETLSPQKLIQFVSAKNVNKANEYVKQTWKNVQVYKSYPWLTEDVDQFLQDSLWNANVSKSAEKKAAGFGRELSATTSKSKAARFFQDKPQPGKPSIMYQVNVFNNGHFQIDYIATKDVAATFREYLTSTSFNKKTTKDLDKIEVWEKDGVTVRIEYGLGIYIYNTAP